MSSRSTARTGARTAQDLAGQSQAVPHDRADRRLLPDRVDADQGRDRDALIAGLPTSFEYPRQQVVYELASALAAARVVPVGLFHRAQDLFGDEGIVDVTVLMGWFTGVSLTLMAYDVPSNATGL